MPDEAGAIGFVDVAVRGGVAGMLVLVVWRLAAARGDARLRGTGTLFALGTAAYAVVSTPLVAALGATTMQTLAFIATLNSVFFWWFATALFDDGFRWRHWRWVPFLLFLALAIGRLVGLRTLAGFVDDVVQQALIIAMLGHALWLALRHRRDDLLEARRSLRSVFVAMLALAGIAFAVGELVLAGDLPPGWLSLVHALILFALCIAFSHRVLELLSEPPGAAERASLSVDPVAELARRRLHEAMDGGVWRTEGLTIGGLAEAIDYPEHKLRRLINRSLGYRNFSAFLNHYRIAEAQRRLADPDNARTQVTQIAFDLGYASLAPFNRAFREATRTTPSEFRRSALAEAFRSD